MVSPMPHVASGLIQLSHPHLRIGPRDRESARRVESTVRIRAIDAIGLAQRDRAALAELVARHPQVRSIAAGHVHRAMVGRLGAVPVLVCPGISSQPALDLDPGHDWTFTDAAPGFAFHALVAGDIASHVERVEPTAPRPAPSE